jgi:hypothetical protein
MACTSGLAEVGEKARLPAPAQEDSVVDPGKKNDTANTHDGVCRHTKPLVGGERLGEVCWRFGPNGVRACRYDITVVRHLPLITLCSRTVVGHKFRSAVHYLHTQLGTPEYNLNISENFKIMIYAIKTCISEQLGVKIFIYL